ncbi:MAG: CBASS cGAMP-activated phospholipase [Burkholderiales bacterium]
MPKSRGNTARANAPLRVLSLTGGGYRGLFSAQVLVELCEQAGRQGPLDHAIDVFAGTSIGGLMACALAVGVPPRRVLDAIDAHGPSVFPAKRQRTMRRIIFGTLYEANNLAIAVEACLGKTRARMKLKDIHRGLIVPAVNWVDGTTEVFMSAFLGKAHASDATLRDVCLATSAAPTYFPPHEVNGAPMLDGGLAVNNPDVLAIMEIARRWPERIARIEMLSIGTAGADPARRAKRADQSGARWAPDIANFIITVQERTASSQANRLLGKRYLRVNHVPLAGHAAFENMDIANQDTREALLAAGTTTARTAYANNRAFLDRILNDKRQ